MGEQPELPSGVVTFVFTDIEGSTRMFRDLGELYPQLLTEHNEILRRVWADHSGVEVSVDGDSFFVAFGDPSDAVRAAVTAVESLDRNDWPEQGRIKVRIGMHTGIGYPRDAGYIAYPVYQAARVGAAAHGGQVLLSPATADLVEGLGDICLHDLGSYRVRDFETPIRMFQAERNEAASHHPALRAEADVSHNLGELPTMIGRTADVTGTRQLLGESRVVSVLGPGGVGKTLLAKTIALAESSRRADGAWFVDMSSSVDRSGIWGALADALDVTVDQVVDHVRDRDLLLVLDNCEQALGPIAGLVTELTEQSPRLSILATSREPLAVASERVWRLSPSDGAADAVELFALNARRVAPDFDIDAHRQVVTDLCARLDHLPLAIELAAARVSAMTPSEIAESLSDPMRILRSRRRDLDPRQRTAAGLVDWSYQLLDDDERLVLRRVGVFSGSCSPTIIEAVCADAGLDRIDVADIVWSLVEKSLLTPVAVPGGTRYEMLATTRAFALTVLAEEDDALAAQQMLGAFYVAQLDPRAPRDTRGWALLSDEVGNIGSLASQLADDDPRLAQWLVWLLAQHWGQSGDARRGINDLTPVMERLDVDGEAVVGMWAAFAKLHIETGDESGATRAVSHGRAHVGDAPRLGAGVLENVDALTRIRRGDLDGARAVAEASLDAASELEKISLLNTVALASAELGDWERAAASFRTVAQIAHDTGQAPVEARSLGGVAEVEQRRGNRTAAASFARDSLRLSSELDMTSDVAFGLIGAARFVAEDQHWREAVVLQRCGEALLETTGTNLFHSDQLISEQLLADAQQALGDHDFAAATLQGRSMPMAEATAASIVRLSEIAATPAHT